MPQPEIVRENGRVVGVFSFTDGFVPFVKEPPPPPDTISESRVLAMCEHLEKQGDPEEANFLLERYLALLG